jgi:hypothetical protein
MDGERRFDLAIREMIQTILSETSYRSSLFMQMVASQGAVSACRQLVRARRPSDGFARLWELKRLDLTAEAHMLRPEFADLFAPEDLDAARKRLRAHGYEPKG